MTESLHIDTITIGKPESIEEQLSRIPPRPGVYMMKNADEKIIYIGKAINLRSRVRSYFREGGDGRISVSFFRGSVERIDTIVTDTEKEALLLENQLIKTHKPRYNVRLRDDKTYISLRLDKNHEWPRVHRIRRKRPGDKALYFGPYSSSSAVKETMRFLQRLFPLRSCPDHVLTNRSRPCMLHQIDRCCAPCVGLVEPEKYQEFVEETILFLRGKSDEVVGLLHKKMEQYSEDLLFEKAAVVRDKIRAIQRTVEQEKVSSHRHFDRDVVAFARGGGRAVFVLFPYRQGNLSTPETHSVKDQNREDSQLLEAFLGQFYDSGRPVPRDVLVPCLPDNAELIRLALESLREGPVRITAPQRGEKKRLMDMAQRNAQVEWDKVMAGEKGRHQVLSDLERGLRASAPPQAHRMLRHLQLPGILLRWLHDLLYRRRTGQVPV